MRVAIGCFLVAMLAFAVQSLVWTRLAVAPAVPPDPRAVLEAFAKNDPGLTIDLGRRYQGRRDLLDPRAALPAWHRFDRDEAVLVHDRISRCPPLPLDPRPRDVALGKALDWHAATCAGALSDAARPAFTAPPFLHPSGRSYASLASALGAQPPIESFHVLELHALDPARLDVEDRALASLSAPAWTALLGGDPIVRTNGALVVADQGPAGVTVLHVHPREAWEQHARRAGLALVAREPSGTCARPATPTLCWEPLPPSARHARLRTITGVASTALVALTALALAVALVRERRRVHADRVHVLRTLTHELRSPATTLKLDIEPLRASFDHLPTSCQEPVLRLSDGVERLHRVLHRSARYMALFETPGAAGALLSRREVSSVNELFASFAEEWPDGINARPAETDAALVTDPEWLGVAVRNLVENAVRHGSPPVEVAWQIVGDELVVRVADRGSTQGFSLRRATSPFERAPGSTGLGLGLAIVARVARLLGGRLVHRPSPTTFELHVPRRIEEAA